MKKTFELEHDKIKYPRMIESAKSKIRKYIKREKRKPLPNGMDYWDFNCKFGDLESTAATIHISEIDANIERIESQSQKSFYIEILSKSKKR